MNTSRALEVLGFSGKDDPSKEELKKRFRILSLRNHPDKGGSSDTFRKINHAYRVLIGEEQVDESHTNTNVMFREVFQGFDKLFSKFHGQNVHKPVKKRIRLNVKELFEGTIRQLEFVKGEMCKKCMGTGSKIRCPNCKGVGHLMVTTNNVPSIKKVQCMECRSRRTVDRGSICGVCNGTKIEYTKIKKSIRIPRGIKNNARVIVGENTETPIELIIQHPNQMDKEWNGWYLNDNTRNLELKRTISLKDAMLGNTITIQHPNNITLDCVIPAGTQSNDIITFKDKGLPPCPSLKMPPTNALIKIKIAIPKIDQPDSIKLTEAFFARITQPGVS